ncbi:MAG: Major facilitator superfamily [Candidatus Magasanikbacteria bacterium]|nr:Major facilitator superfamily [Candidatus Magasanikbacteria bacterium]
MTRPERLKLNPRLLFWAKTLNEVKALNAVVALFYLSRGVTIEQIFYFSIVWSLTEIIFEIPTGFLADKFGRKAMMILGGVLQVLSFAATFFAHGFLQFIGVFILMALAYACFSGTEEALLYDSLKELNQEHTMTKENGRLHAARSLAKIFIPALGAFVARDLLDWQFNILIAVNVVMAMAALVIMFFFKEPRHFEDVAAYEIGIFRESIRTIRAEPFLFRAAMNKLLIFIGSLIVWRAYQPYFSAHSMSSIWLIAYYIICHIIIFSGHWNVSIIVKKIGAPRLMTWTILGTIVSLAAAYFSVAKWLIFLSLLLPLIFEGVREPVFSHSINRLIHSRSRATTLSNLNLLQSIFEIPLMAAAGLLVRWRLEYTFLLAAALCLAVLLFFPIRVRDLAEPAVREELEVG